MWTFTKKLLFITKNLLNTKKREGLLLFFNSLRTDINLR